MVRARLERMTVILTGAAISTRLSLAASFGASRGVPGCFGAFGGVSGCVRAPPSVWGVLTDPGGCLVRSDNGAVCCELSDVSEELCSLLCVCLTRGAYRPRWDAYRLRGMLRVGMGLGPGLGRVLRLGLARC